MRFASGFPNRPDAEYLVEDGADALPQVELTDIEATEQSRRCAANWGTSWRTAELDPMIRAQGSARSTGPYAWSRPPWLVVIATAVVTAALVSWVLLRPPDTEPQRAISENLSFAQDAIIDRRYITPSDHSAVHYYRAVLAIDPANTEAFRGLARIADRLIADAQSFIPQNKLADAAMAINGVREIRPDHPALPAVEARLREQQDRLVELSRKNAQPNEASPAKVAAETAAPNQLATPPSQVRSGAMPALNRARQRLKEGLLVTPQNDSAQFHLAIARRAEPDNPAVLQGWKALHNAIVVECYRAIAQDDLDDADRWIAAARQAEVPDSDVNTLGAALARARQTRAKKELLELVLLRTTENRLEDSDGALSQLQRLQKMDPTFGGLQQAIDALGTSLVAAARLSIQNNDLQRADRLLAGARAIGYDRAELRTAETGLRDARTTPSIIEQPAAQPVRLKRVRYLAPEYPQPLRDRRVEGWVDLQLAIAPTGDVVAAKVINSSRAGAFERSASKAALQWKYTPWPSSKPGSVHSELVRVTFDLQD